VEREKFCHKLIEEVIMNHQQILNLLCDGPVIPAVRTYEDYKHVLFHIPGPSVILLFGDINTLPGLLAEAQKHGKRLLVHLDLLEGIGKDRAGIKMLARLGVNSMITTKSHLAKNAREEGMLVIQRLFLMDSEALKHGIHLLKGFTPDVVEVLPATVPASVVRQLAKATGVPILGGGLVFTEEEVRQALASGIGAVSTSQKSLWKMGG
jgi:glycerol uptake operon antiterminator